MKKKLTAGYLRKLIEHLPDDKEIGIYVSLHFFAEDYHYIYTHTATEEFDVEWCEDTNCIEVDCEYNY